MRARGLKALIAALAFSLSMGLSARKPALLAGHEDYFEHAKLEKGVLSADATEDFEALSPGARDAEIKKMMRDLSDTLESLKGPLLFRLSEGSGHSLWALPENGRQPLSLGSWDRTRELVPPDSKAGRWFLYVGIGASFGVPYSLATTDLGLNGGVKLGTYLLQDKFDVGVSLNGSSSLGFSENGFNTDYGAILGVFSRMHFPIYGPFGGSVGLEGAYNTDSSSSTPLHGNGSSNSSSSTEGALLGGLSYFFPSGSIDFDARLSTQTTYNIGLTTFLGGHAAPAVAEPEEAVPTPKRRAKTRVSPTPVPSLGLSPSPQTTPTEEPTDEATEAPTQVPTATTPPTSTPVPPTPTPQPSSTSVPTPVPTLEPTVDKKAEEAAQKLDAERKALDEEKAKLADERKKLEEEKAVASEAKTASTPSASAGKRSGFSLGGGIWDPKFRSDFSSDQGSPVNLGFDLFLGDWRLGVDMLDFEGEIPNSGSGSGSGSGFNPNNQYHFSNIGVNAGYDWTFLGDSRQTGFQMYLPARLQADFMSWKAGSGNEQGTAVDASLGLGLRYRFVSWLALDFSGRYHAHLLGGDFNNGDTNSGSGGSGGGSNNNSGPNDKASLEGPEFKLAANIYLW